MADVRDAYANARREIEDKINARLQSKNYGTALEKCAFIAVIVDFGDSNYGEIKKYWKQRKVAEFRSKIDYAQFKAASAIAQRRLVMKTLVRSLSAIPEIVSKDLDHTSLLTDVTQVGQGEGWL